MVDILLWMEKIIVKNVLNCQFGCESMIQHDQMIMLNFNHISLMYNGCELLLDSL